MAQNKKKIFLISCARSDFDLLNPLYASLKKNNTFNTSLICCGSILSKEYGYNKSTLKKNQKKIIFINNKIKNNERKNIITANYKMNLGLFNFLKKENPDLCVILGDRIETINIAIVIKMLNIPIAHLHGGESTEGVYDDYWRHAITKISNLHFVSNNQYKKNLIKMGEQKKNIYLVGAYGIENTKKLNKKFYNKNFFMEKHNFIFNKLNFLVTFHSNTFDVKNNIKYFRNIIGALLKIKNSNIFISIPGYDLGSEGILKFLSNKNIKNNKRIFQFSSIGYEKYLSLAKNCDIVLGNSSSGIIEIPYLNIPVINIGSRQNGRIKPNLVFDSSYEKNKIYSLILKILKLIQLNRLPYNNKIYGDGKSSQKTIKILKSINFTSINKKKFF